jgi:uncharacterized protein with PIN domain
MKQKRVNPEAYVRAKVKAEQDKKYRLCIEQGICPYCNVDLKINYSDDEESWDEFFVCSQCGHKGMK